MAEDTKALTVATRPGELIAVKAEEMARAMIQFLPGGSTLPEPTRRAMAMLAVNNGLDPFLGEVYAIPQKRKNDHGQWEVVGYALGIGRGGWLRNAERSGLYRGHGFRELTAPEAKALDIRPGDIGIVCFVTKVAERYQASHSGYAVEGFGVVRSDEPTKMDHFKCARKRAFVDALRMAFPMSVPKENGESMAIRVVDDETGEVLGNGHDLSRASAPQAVAQEPAECAQFTEAAPADTSVAPYQPEGMPVVETTAQPSRVNVVPAQVSATDRPTAITAHTKPEFMALVAQWLPRYQDKSNPTQANEFSVNAHLLKAKIGSFAHPDAWTSLCKSNDEHEGVAA